MFHGMFHGWKWIVFILVQFITFLFFVKKTLKFLKSIEVVHCIAL